MSTNGYSWLVGPNVLANNPSVYQWKNQLYDWFTGEPVPWKAERVLVRTESGRDYWTWEDDKGQRQWEISAKV